MSLERDYQSKLIKRLERQYPGCHILKQDSGMRQGLPDLLILYQDRWAMLEVKASAKSRSQPNQAYYISLFSQMSFASFIYPENEEEVLRELYETFKFDRATRLSLSE